MEKTKIGNNKIKTFCQKFTKWNEHHSQCEKFENQVRHEKSTTGVTIGLITDQLNNSIT